MSITPKKQTKNQTQTPKRSACRKTIDVVSHLHQLHHVSFVPHRNIEEPGAPSSSKKRKPKQPTRSGYALQCTHTPMTPQAAECASTSTRHRTTAAPEKEALRYMLVVRLSVVNLYFMLKLTSAKRNQGPKRNRTRSVLSSDSDAYIKTYVRSRDN